MYGIREGYAHRPEPKTYSAEESRAYWSDYRLDSSRYYQYYVYERARRIFDERGYTSVIDVGCGSAFKLNHFFAGKAPRVVGVDQLQAVTWAKNQWKNGIEFIATNLEAPDELNEKFDLVICSDVIEHLADPDALLAWLRRLLAPGGVIILSTPDRAVLYGKDFMEPRNPEHVREWTFDEFASYVRRAGFTIEESGHTFAMRFSFSRMWISHLRALGIRKMRHCMYFVVTPSA